MPETRSLAREVFDKMMEGDHFSRWLGIDLIEVDEGYCKLQMTVREEMLNGYAMLHGGVTFAFADSAFAFASNSYGRISVSLHASVTYNEPGKSGDVLIAEAKEVALGNKTATFDVTVVKAGSTKALAVFRGTVYRTSKQVLDKENDDE